MSYHQAMEKKIDFTEYYADLEKGGAIIDKAIAGTATDDEIIKVKEIIWTIVCKIFVKDLLTDLPMQQKELARLVNVKPTMITAYKKGRALPSLQTLIMMISVLKPELLFTITDGKIKDVNDMLKSLGLDLFL